MVYTVIPTQKVGELWTAADSNLVQANFAAGIPDLMTTKGDVVVATGANAAERLAAGSNGSFLRANSGASGGVDWNLPGQHAAKYTRTTTLSLANVTDVRVDFATQVFDIDSAVTTGASWKYTVPTTGWYFISLSLALQASTAWEATSPPEGLIFKLYPSPLHLYVRYAKAYITASGGYRFYLNNTILAPLTASNEVYLEASQGSDATQTVDGAAANNYISIVRVF